MNLEGKAKQNPYLILYYYSQPNNNNQNFHKILTYLKKNTGFFLVFHRKNPMQEAGKLKAHINST